MSDENDREEREESRGVSVNVGGDVHGDVKSAGGDLVEGDKITVGDITDSNAVAIGRGAQASATQGVDAAELAKVIAQIYEGLDALDNASEDDVADAKAEIEQIKNEIAEKGEEADESFLKSRFRNLVRMGPDILDVVTSVLASPVVGATMIVRKIAEKAREEAGLDKV